MGSCNIEKGDGEEVEKQGCKKEEDVGLFGGL